MYAKIKKQSVQNQMWSDQNANWHRLKNVIKLRGIRTCDSLKQGSMWSAEEQGSCAIVMNANNLTLCLIINSENNSL